MTRHATTLMLLAAGAVAAACGGGGRSAAAPTPYPTDEASLSRPLPQPVPDVVARVNGVTVRVEQVVPLAKKELDNHTASEVEAMKPAALRRALLRYVDRELLLQEALARGLGVDTRQVDWAYDQARKDYPDDTRWAEFLRGEGLDPQRLRTELRVQGTVEALLDAEVGAQPVSEADARQAYAEDPTSFVRVSPSTPPPVFEVVKNDIVRILRERQRQAVTVALLERLRAKARIEILI